MCFQSFDQVIGNVFLGSKEIVGCLSRETRPSCYGVDCCGLKAELGEDRICRLKDQNP